MDVPLTIATAVKFVLEVYPNCVFNVGCVPNTTGLTRVKILFTFVVDVELPKLIVHVEPVPLRICTLDAVFNPLLI